MRRRRGRGLGSRHGIAVRRAQVGSRVVKVTNPDKVLFPDAGHTKHDLVDYYRAVGDGIVRALRERPTQLRRFRTGSQASRSTRSAFRRSARTTSCGRSG